MNIQWDAEKYAQDFSFVPKHGADLIGMLDKETVHTVLDLGCGGGVLTKQLSEAGFSVLGMDASETQLALAEKTYPDIAFRAGDATDFSLQTPVDAVFPMRFCTGFRVANIRSCSVVSIAHYCRTDSLFSNAADTAMQMQFTVHCGRHSGSGIWTIGLHFISRPSANIHRCWSKRGLKWFRQNCLTVRRP